MTRVEILAGLREYITGTAKHRLRDEAVNRIEEDERLISLALKALEEAKAQAEIAIEALRSTRV
jgi:hypothetical protein